MRKIALAILGLAIVFPAAAASPMACDKRDDILRHLEGKYSEKPVAVGVANNGGIVEVLTNGKGSTWTIIITLPTGMSCLVAAGEDWEELPQVAFGTKA